MKKTTVVFGVARVTVELLYDRGRSICWDSSHREASSFCTTDNHKHNYSLCPQATYINLQHVA